MDASGDRWKRRGKAAVGSEGPGQGKQVFSPAKRGGDLYDFQTFTNVLYDCPQHLGRAHIQAPCNEGSFLMLKAGFLHHLMGSTF